MSGESAQDAVIAVRLLAAIDELVAFVSGRYCQPGRAYHLSEEDRGQLSDLEGRVVGLLAKLAGGRIAFENHPPGFSQEMPHTEFTGIPHYFGHKGMALTRSPRWEDKMRALRAAVQAVMDAEQRPESSGQTRGRPTKKSKASSATKKSRNRKSRTAQLLLVFLEDRRNTNLNYSELAKELGVHVSSISRAFHHKKYGPEILRRYHEVGVRPPGIRQL